MATCTYYVLEMLRVSHRARLEYAGPYQPYIRQISKCDHPRSCNRPDTEDSEVECGGDSRLCALNAIDA